MELTISEEKQASIGEKSLFDFLGFTVRYDGSILFKGSRFGISLKQKAQKGYEKRSM